jgi:hypothetical protein
MFPILLLDMHQNFFVKVTDAQVSLNSINKMVGSQIRELQVADHRFVSYLFMLVINQQARNGQLNHTQLTHAMRIWNFPSINVNLQTVNFGWDL